MAFANGKSNAASGCKAVAIDQSSDQKALAIGQQSNDQWWHLPLARKVASGQSRGQRLFGQWQLQWSVLRPLARAVAKAVASGQSSGKWHWQLLKSVALGIGNWPELWQVARVVASGTVIIGQSIGQWHW